MVADGYTILVTWPDFAAGQHRQEVWYAYLGDQTDAGRVVQEACGVLNKAKVEILGQIAGRALAEHGVAPGRVKRAAENWLGKS